MRAIVVTAALAALAGCIQAPDMGRMSFATFGSARAAPVQNLSLYSGAFTVLTPNGFCIDARASRPADGFAVMAPCNVVLGGGQKLTPQGLVTIQVGAAGSALVTGAADEMATLLTSAQGAQLLSAAGEAATVKVDSSEAQGDLVEVHFTDSAPAQIKGLQDTEWRAFFDLGDRLVTVAVRGYDHSPMSVNEGLALLRASVAAQPRPEEQVAVAPNAG